VPNFAAAGSPDGRAWMAAVPALSGHLARQWDLTVTSEWFRHGYNAAEQCRMSRTIPGTTSRPPANSPNFPQADWSTRLTRW